MKLQALDGRLLTAAGFVRQGAVFADIGTDHAHLPIFLLESGRIARAFCSDINEGPLDSAKRNAREAGVEDLITFKLTDGASGLSGFGITDYAICGMGGELIASIIEASEHLRSIGVRLILQPMTKPAELRRALAKLGFSVIGEEYSCDSDKRYLCICAEYIGSPYEISPIEAEIGKDFVKNDNNSSQILYYEAKKRAVLRRIEGKSLGGESSVFDRELLAAIEKRLSLLT